MVETFEENLANKQESNSKYRIMVRELGGGGLEYTSEYPFSDLLVKIHTPALQTEWSLESIPFLKRMGFKPFCAENGLCSDESRLKRGRHFILRRKIRCMFQCVNRLFSLCFVFVVVVFWMS